MRGRFIYGFEPQPHFRIQEIQELLLLGSTPLEREDPIVVETGFLDLFTGFWNSPISFLT